MACVVGDVCVAGGHAWHGGLGIHGRGVHVWGVCMAGSVHGGGHVWQGVYVVGGMCGGGACMAGNVHGGGCA